MGQTIVKLFGNLRTPFLSSGIYLSASLLHRVIFFALLPLLTRVLSPWDMGILATFQAVYALGETFVDHGTSTFLLREYEDVKDKPSELRRYIGNTIGIKIILAAVFLILLFFLAPWLLKTAHFEPWLLCTLPLLAFMSAFTNAYLRFWIIQKKALAYGVFHCLQGAVNAGFTVLLIIVFALHWKGRILGIALAELMGLLTCVVLLLKSDLFSVNMDRDVWKRMLKFGTPLFIYGMGQWVINLSDRFFLNAMVDVSATGIYSIGYTLGGLTEMIAGSVGFAIMPTLFEKLRDPSIQQKKKIVTMVHIYLLGLLGITLTWIVIAPTFLDTFVGEKYHEARVYIPWIAMAFFAHGVFRIFSIFITYSKKTVCLTVAVIAAAVVNIILNYFFIGAFGAIGVAYATLIAFSVKAGLAIYFTVKIFDMPWLSFMTLRDGELTKSET